MQARLIESGQGRPAWASVLAVLLAVAAPLGLSPASAARPAADADDAPACGSLPLAYESTTLAHFLNPALLGGRATAGACGWVGYRDRATEFWQAALRMGGVSLGYRAFSDPAARGACEAVGADQDDGAGGDCEPVHPRRELSLCAALGEMPITPRARLGHRVRRAWGDHEDAWRWDIGISWPAATWLTVGVVARDLAQDRLDGVLLRRAYHVGLAAGPLIRALNLQVVATAEALGREDHCWSDEAILRAGLIGRHRSGTEVRVAVDSRWVDGERDAVLVVGLTVPTGQSQLLAAAARDRRAGVDQPQFGFGFVEERR